MTSVTGRRVGLRLAVGRAGVRFVAAGAVYGLAAVVYSRASGRTGQPPLAGVVGVTVVVAVLLWLLSARIDRFSARMLLGRQADVYQVMRALTRQLSGTLPVDEVAPRVAQAAVRATGQPRAEVRLWLPGGERWTRSWPPAAPPIGGGATVGVRHTGTTVGEIAVEVEEGARAPLSMWDRQLLDDLARPAGAALSTVRLTVELRRRRAELERLTVSLQASRDRLLAARSSEQHRMRADVASRVSPHLSAALGCLASPTALPTASTGAVDPAPEELAAENEWLCTSEAFASAGAEAALALDELRSIARGVFPPTLSEVGLAASLESWLARAGVGVTVDVPAELTSLAPRPDLQACLYFCAVTSLSRLVGHDAQHITLTVTEGPGLALRVGAQVAESVAREVVEAVTDRIEAVGGAVESEMGVGRFTLVATIPLRTSVLS